MSGNRRWTVPLCLAMGLCLPPAFAGMAAADEALPYRIATGDPGGVYYPVAGAICALVNRVAEGRPPCRSATSNGSIDNIEKLRTGQARFAIVQGDILSQAYEGVGLFSDWEPFSGLRTIFTLHGETLTILAHADSGIRSFDQLKGRRVNLGNVGSGQRATLNAVLAELGWSLDVFDVVSEVSATDQTPELCEGELEAGAYIVGHPAGVIANALGRCDLVLVSADTPAIRRIVGAREDFRMMEIAKASYGQLDATVPTFGVVASLVTTRDTPGDVIDALVSSVMRDLDLLTSAHPALSSLTPATMVAPASTVPFHGMATRYFQVSGFIDPGTSLETGR